MAKRPIAPSEPRLAKLNVEQMRRGIERLRKRMDDLNSFDPNGVARRFDPQVTALETSIADTLDRIFGPDTVERRRFDVGHLDGGPIQMSLGRGYEPDFKPYLEKGKARALAAIGSAIKALEEEVEEQSAYATLDKGRLEVTPVAPTTTSKRIFIVHGREEGPRESVARFLEKLGFTPIILNEQANQGRTVIEKVEAYSDVGFAVVLLTPDDEGNLKGERPQDRARQNVILELGFFIGRLGREYVCTLVSGSVEIPSDWRGVVDERFEANGAWKQMLARELQAANHPIDWNLVMN